LHRAGSGKLCADHLDASLEEVVSCGRCAVALLKWFYEHDAEALDAPLDELDYSRPFDEELE